MKYSKKQLKAAILTGLAALAAAVWLSYAGPAGARPDELLRPDAPYPVPPAAPPAVAQASGIYVVKTGDTLTGIAGRRGVNMELLAVVNNIGNPDSIRAGQVLKVPAGCTVHRVRPGETLWDIARTYRVNVRTIVERNGLTDQDCIIEGQELLIPYDVMEAPARSMLSRKTIRLFNWPLYGDITSPFGLREGRPHEGIDIAADEGEPIRAAARGRVVFAGPRGTYGNAVIIDHGQGARTLYAHCSKLLVREGDQVDESTLIALAGNTGRSHGPHLHLEVLYEGEPQDPVNWLPSRRYYG